MPRGIRNGSPELANFPLLNESPLVIGKYFTTPGVEQTDAVMPTLNQLLLVPFSIPRGGRVLSAAQALVRTTAGDADSRLRIGIWRNGGFQPGTVLWDSGLISGASTGLKGADPALGRLPEDIYWWGVAWQDGGATATAPKIAATAAPHPWIGLTAPASSVVGAAYAVASQTGAFTSGPFTLTNSAYGVKPYLLASA